MSANNHHKIYKRANSGTTFSIIFGTIAVCVIIACAFWGLIIPKWRNRNVTQHPKAKWNNGSVLTRRRSRRVRSIWPDHPAVRPLLSKPSTAQILPTYNPRIESPFVSEPGPGFTRSLRTINSRINSAPVYPTKLSSDGLFTPARRGAAEREARGKYHTVPRGQDAKHVAGTYNDFGDAKELILAVPEPLALKPRDAGRPPAVKSHVDKCGNTRASSAAGSDKLLHPNKLFQAIRNGGDIRSSVCSTTSLRVEHRASDLAAARAAKEMADAVDQAIEEEAGRTEYYDAGSDTSSKATSRDGISPASSRDRSMTALHRLCSYRSLTGIRSGRSSRAGTVHRPKTPIGQLRTFCEHSETTSSIPLTELSCDRTRSTVLTTQEASSENGSASTTTTLPILLPSTLQLLPTPLKPSVRIDMAAHVIASDQHISPSPGGLTILVSMPKTSIDEKREKKQLRGFHQTGRRNKPMPLHIAMNECKSSPNNHQTRQSVTEMGASVMGSLVKPSQLKTIVRASSMYSRDTHGFSSASTPTTPDLPSPVIDIFADQDVYGNLFHGRESVKDRITEWTQRIDGLVTPPLSRSAYVPPHSVPIARTIQAANINDKQDTISGELTSNTTTIQVTQQETHMAPAPGGAVWI